MNNNLQNIGLAIFALVLNILFHIPMGGISGFMILYQEGGHGTILAFVLQGILLYSFISMVIFSIKRW